MGFLAACRVFSTATKFFVGIFRRTPICELVRVNCVVIIINVCLILHLKLNFSNSAHLNLK